MVHQTVETGPITDAVSPKPKVQLSDWIIKDWGPYQILEGVVKGHPMIPDGERINTTRILWINMHRSIAETKNTIYVLN